MKLLLGLTLVVVGCAGSLSSRWQSRPYVTQVGSATDPLRAPPGKSLVVFVKPSDYESVSSGLGPADYRGLLASRPSLWRPNRVDTIIDEHGRYLGDILPVSHFGVVVDPGHHLFAVVTIPDALGGRVRSLEVDLAPDKAYFVEIGSGEAFDLLPIKPGSSSWSKREAWLANTTRLAPDGASGEAELAAFVGYTRWTTSHAQQTLDHLAPDARAHHRLAPGDGL